MFILIMTIAILRFAGSPQFRLWAAGWATITVGHIFGLFSAPRAFSLPDVLSISGMVVGGTLIVIARRRRVKTRRVGTGILLSVLGSLIYASVCYLLTPPAVVANVPAHLYSSLVFSVLLVGLLPTRARGVFFTLFKSSVAMWIPTSVLFSLTLLSPDSLYPVFLWAEMAILVLMGGAIFGFLLMLNDFRIRQEIAASAILGGIIQHDVRNYLQTIASSLELMRTDEERFEEWLQLAGETTEQAIVFVNQMREFSVATLRSAAPTHVLDIVDVVTSVVETMNRLRRSSRQHIAFEPCAELRVIASTVVRQVVWNIIDNSFKHGSKVVTVGCGKTDDHAYVTIEDQAGGLDEETIAYLTDPDIAYADAPGLGMGIILIKGLTGMSGGELHVENISGGDGTAIGTRFTVLLPLAK